MRRLCDFDLYFQRRLHSAGTAFVLPIALLALGGRPLPAQHALSLDEVLARALRENLDLRAARLRADSARAEVRIVRAFPNPAASISPANPYQSAVGVPLDVGPQRTFRVRAGRDGAAASVSDVRDAERQVRFAVRTAFYDLVLADSIRSVLRDERDIFGDLLVADSARVRAGSVPERNIVKSELELAKAEAALFHADADVRAARLALQTTMGIARPDTTFTVTGSLSAKPIPGIAAGWADSLIAVRPDIEAARHRTELSEDAKRYSVALLLPTPELTLVQQRSEPFPNGEHYALGLGVQLPLWNWFSGERARAAASVEQARVSEARTRSQAFTEIAAALDQYRAAEQLARRFDAGLLAKSLSALETARYAYAAGALSYVELLDAVRTYGQIRADAATAGHDYWVSAFAVARSLDREVVQP